MFLCIWKSCRSDVTGFISITEIAPSLQEQTAYGWKKVSICPAHCCDTVGAAAGLGLKGERTGGQHDMPYRRETANSAKGEQTEIGKHGGNAPAAAFCRAGRKGGGRLNAPTTPGRFLRRGAVYPTSSPTTTPCSDPTSTCRGVWPTSSLSSISGNTSLL